jgi:peroxiredoxin
MRWTNPFRASFLLLSAVLAFGAQTSSDCEDSIILSQREKLGQQAPDFTLDLLQEENAQVHLSDIASRGPLLLVFWATWCDPCVDEISVLNDWTQKYAPRGLTILGVNIQESREALLAFLQENPMAYPSLLDQEGEVAQQYDLVGIPASVFLAKGGRILYYGFGLPDNIENLLARH